MLLLYKVALRSVHASVSLPSSIADLTRSWTTMSSRSKTVIALCTYNCMSLSSNSHKFPKTVSSMTTVSASSAHRFAGHEIPYHCVFAEIGVEFL